MNDFLDAFPFASGAGYPLLRHRSRERRAYPVRATEASFEVNAAREELERKGWSYRTAAPELGCSVTHLSWVLTGRRQSRRLLEAIAAMPNRKETDR